MLRITTVASVARGALRSVPVVRVVVVAPVAGHRHSGAGKAARGADVAAHCRDAAELAAIRIFITSVVACCSNVVSVVSPDRCRASFSSPLSIPSLLETFVPQLESAADGDPSTEVPVGA